MLNCPPIDSSAILLCYAVGLIQINMFCLQNPFVRQWSGSFILTANIPFLFQVGLRVDVNGASLLHCNWYYPMFSISNTDMHNQTLHDSSHLSVHVSLFCQRVSLSLTKNHIWWDRKINKRTVMYLAQPNIARLFSPFYNLQCLFSYC